MPEASGLSNKDLSFSNYILQIPTSSKFKSLNLSHSMIIVCYEIFDFQKKKIKKNNLPLKYLQINILSFVNHLTNLLEEKNFFYQRRKSLQ